jgi:hypothetical protein
VQQSHLVAVVDSYSHKVLTRFPDLIAEKAVVNPNVMMKDLPLFLIVSTRLAMPRLIHESRSVHRGD